MLSSIATLLLIGGASGIAAAASARVLPRDGGSPSLPYDQNTTKYCSWWIDLTTATSCSTLLDENFILLEEFNRWNPAADCENLVVGNSYCVETAGEPAPIPSPQPSPTTLVTSTSSKAPVSPSSSSKLTSSSTSTTPPTAVTSTSVGNGVATPTPTQAGMVGNCNRFYYIAKSVTCSQVLSDSNITLEQFVRWNPSVGSDCSGMWAEVNVCVGVIGDTTTAPKPSSTTPGNGVQTPQPTQDGMVGNCNKFYYTAKGVTCSQVLSDSKITLAQFAKWNPSVGSDCSGMWAGVNVCVGVIGGSTPTTTTPTPTPTSSAGNGIQTPQPTQPGMVTNCKKFHYVSEGDQCWQITSYEKISQEDFAKWNTGLGSDCGLMWAKTYVCVGV